MCSVIFGVPCFTMADTYTVAHMGNSYKLVSKFCDKLTFAYKHKIKLYFFIYYLKNAALNKLVKSSVFE